MFVDLKCRERAGKRSVKRRKTINMGGNAKDEEASSSSRSIKNTESNNRSRQMDVKNFSASSAAVHAVELADRDLAGNSFDSSGAKESTETAINVFKLVDGSNKCTLDTIEALELTVNPVTRIASEYTENMNCSVAVNDEFISYGLKQGHIRVLHRYSSARALLKGHVGPVACMCFLSNNILAAGGMDGKLFVWKVTATDDENALEVKMLVSALFSPGCDTSGVIVSPVSLSMDTATDEMTPCMAVAVCNAVMLMGVSAGSKDGEGSLIDIDPLNPAPYGTRFPDFPLQDEITSMSTSRKGVLALGSKRGRVYVGNLQKDGSDIVGSKLTPMTMGECVDGVDWISDDVLMVSTQEGRCKRLYCSGEDGLQFADELVLGTASGSAPYIHTSCILEQHVACLADTRNKSVYVLTFQGLKGSTPSFESLARFSVGQAILSMTACWNQDAAEEGRGGLELNCVQTDAVQQYYIDADLFIDHDDESPREEDIRDTIEESKDENSAENKSAIAELERLNLVESVDGTNPGMLSSRLLTPSDIISSQNDNPVGSNDSFSHIKILKRGEKIDAIRKSVEGQDEPSDGESDEESPEENTDVQSVPLALLEDSSASALYTMIVRAIKENSTNQSNMIKKALKDQRKIMDEQMTKMAKNLDKKLTSQVKAEIKSLQSNLNSAIQSAAKESIRTILPKEIMGSVKTSLDKQLSGAVQQGLNKPIQDSFKHSFIKQIVPAFESSCQTMFRQLDDALTRGLKEHFEVSRQSFEEPLELTQALQKSLSTAQILAERIGDFQNDSGMAAISASTSGGIRSPKHQDPKKELQTLIQMGKYNEAFSKVLSLQDLSTLGWLCSIVDAPSTLAISPPVLSQMVLLSLLQQLAADLNHGATSKLQWIREAAMAINPSDQSIAAHIKPVLEQVAAALQANLPRLSPTDASSCKLTLHVVRSQMQA